MTQMTLSAFIMKIIIGLMIRCWKTYSTKTPA